jgi:phosphatidylinositol 4-kinase
MLLLVRHELNRLVAWHDAAASNRAANIPGIASLKTFVKPPQKPSDRTWREYLHLAATVDPTLLVFMAVRYPAASSLTLYVQQEVAKHPTAFSHLPEALLFLVTPSSVACKHPSLENISTWAPVSPVAALQLLHDYPDHDTIVQYALRVLHSFKPDVILFYIPQLVQALRYDRKGFVQQYMLRAAQHSQLLAHQMIWNMKTNVYTYVRVMEVGLGVACWR